VRRADGSVLVQGIISDVSYRADADERAAEAADRFITLLDVVGEHVYVAAAGPNGELNELFQGPGADRLLGGAEPDEDMNNWESAIHPDDRPVYDSFNEALMRGERSEAEYRLHGADGITRWVHDRAATRDRIDGTLEISGIVSDVTERRRLEDELRRTVAEMEATHRQLEEAHHAAELIAHTDDLTGALSRRRFTTLAAAGGLRDRGVLLLDADHFKRINDRHGHAVGDFVLVELAARIRAALDDGELLARWGGEEFVVLVSGVHSDAELRDRAERIRLTVGSAPVACGSVMLGVSVSVGAVRTDPSLSLDRLVDAADRALYIAKARGRDQVRLLTDGRADEDVTVSVRAGEETDQLRTAWAVAQATSLGQDDHHDHLLAVSDLCARIAHRLGLDETQIMRCRLAGLLHDVGKVAIPDSVIDKPGQLTSEEWAVMRSHTAHGETIVSSFPDLRELAPVVRHHHERWDGGGYPRGVVRENIPIEGRIVAIADVFDALTSHRVYRDAFSVEKAVEMMREESGRHFDPVLLEAFMEVLGSSGADARARERSNPRSLLDRALVTYTDAMCLGDAEHAEGAIAAAIEDGIDPATLQNEVIGPAMQRVEQLCQEGELDSEAEQLAQSITRRVLATMNRYMLAHG
jgi:diguanylate cyclase (GGDEF)-like protein/putative nucleotidyltransferase with HDIG domain